MKGRSSARGRGGKGGGAGVHGEQVVHAGPGHQLPVAAQVGGGLDGVQHQVPAGHLVLVEPGLLLDEADQVAFLYVVAEAPDRLEVALAVELEPVGVHRAVQVHGQLRYAQQRAVHVDQAVAAVPQGEAARDAEVAVEPGVEQRPAVDLDGDLPPAVRAGVGLRLHAQVRGVGVGADDPVRGVGLGALGDVPGHDGAAAQHVLAAVRAVPGVRLLDLPEPGLLQACGRVGHGVVLRRARREEGHQVVGVAAVEAGRCAHAATLTAGADLHSGRLQLPGALPRAPRGCRLPSAPRRGAAAMPGDAGVRRRAPGRPPTPRPRRRLEADIGSCGLRPCPGWALGPPRPA